MSRLFFSSLTLFTLLVLFSAVFGERGLLHLQRLRQESRALEERAFILMHQNRELRSRILRLRTNDSFLEKVAREQLGLVKEGEIIYRFHRQAEEEKRDTLRPPLAAQ
jgi:cell division protein FtsB